MKKTLYSIAIALFVTTISFAQETPVRSNIDLNNWQHLSLEKNKVYGINTQQALDFLKTKKKLLCCASLLRNGG